MERPKCPYSLNKRPTTKQNHFIYYVRFRNPESGEYLSPVSSGKSNKSAAMDWAEERIDQGGIGSVTKHGITFAQYAEGFWTYETSAYIQGKLARGASFSRTFANIRAGHCRTYLIPALNGFSHFSLSPRKIEQWLLSLRQSTDLTGKTINQLVKTLRAMLKQAVFEGLVASNPCMNIPPSRKRPGKRGF